MPAWYTLAIEELRACHQAAGLFDASYMGLFEVTGSDACYFLDLVQPNDVLSLKPGTSVYSYLLDVDGSVLDDVVIYMRGPNRYMLRVSGGNCDKDWAWLNAIRENRVIISRERPWIRWHGDVVLRDLGDECRLNLLLEGPRACDILRALAASTPGFAEQIERLKRDQLCEGNLAGRAVLISRSGSMGELPVFEIFAHPDHVSELWDEFLETGRPFGLRPVGLSAYDSLRVEAGLPLYGHELAGPLNLSPADAGLGAFAKLYKPFFIGRQAWLAHQPKRIGKIVRFRMDANGARVPRPFDPLVDARGTVVGKVTSCAMDIEGHFIGQAFVLFQYAKEGMLLWMADLPAHEEGDLCRETNLGDQMQGAQAITIIGRMPGHKR